MGWCIRLTADKPIEPADIDHVVQELPPTLRGAFSVSTRQAWGWSTAVDISNPEGMELHLSGSFTQSGQIAEAAAQTIARLLEHKDYRIAVGELTG